MNGGSAFLGFFPFFETFLRLLLAETDNGCYYVFFFVWLRDTQITRRVFFLFYIAGDTGRQEATVRCKSSRLVA